MHTAELSCCPSGPECIRLQHIGRAIYDKILTDTAPGRIGTADSQYSEPIDCQWHMGSNLWAKE